MSTKNNFMRPPVREKAGQPEEKGSSYFKGPLTIDEMHWIHVDCERCKEWVLAVPRTPQDCPLCGCSQVQIRQLPKVKAMEEIERIHTLPYYEKKRAWILKNIFPKLWEERGNKK